MERLQDRSRPRLYRILPAISGHRPLDCDLHCCRGRGNYRRCRCISPAQKENRKPGVDIQPIRARPNTTFTFRLAWPSINWVGKQFPFFRDPFYYFKDWLMESESKGFDQTFDSTRSGSSLWSNIKLKRRCILAMLERVHATLISSRVENSLDRTLR